MAADGIDYGGMMHDAMRDLIARVLRQVAEGGLPGDHHFFLTFDTTHAEVDIADWLRERYPDEMTIVLQHWFEGLEVDEDGFAVTLNFGDQPETLRVPWNALRTFVDPSVEFGLRFEEQGEGASRPTRAAPSRPAKPGAATETPSSVPAIRPAAKPPTAKPVRAAKAEDAAKGDAEVVQLDKFRK